MGVFSYGYRAFVPQLPRADKGRAAALRALRGGGVETGAKLVETGRQIAPEPAMPHHAETRILPFGSDQMFALVGDVASYPRFLPWTAAARVRSVTPQGDHSVMLADLVISFKVFRETFGSRVTLWPDLCRIDTAYLDGPFKYLESQWNFRDVAGGCEVSFVVDFEFRNRLLQGAAGMFFNEAMQRIVRAFERRAHELYPPIASSSSPSA